MNKSIQMILVLSLIALISGLLLGGLNEMTKETIENNILKFKKIPAVADIYQTVNGTSTAQERLALEENLLAEKRYLDLEDGSQMLFFVIRKEGVPYAITLENSGKGFGGDLGVMTGFELETGNLVGIGITTLSETPGLGTRVKESIFRNQFSNLPAGQNLAVKKDGGSVDAITGATVSSRAVCQAINQSIEAFKKHQASIKTASGQ